MTLSHQWHEIGCILIYQFNWRKYWEGEPARYVSVSYFSIFIILDCGSLFLVPRFVFGRVVLGASLQYLFDGLPIVFSAL